MKLIPILLPLAFLTTACYQPCGDPAGFVDLSVESGRYLQTGEAYGDLSVANATAQSWTIDRANETATWRFTAEDGRLVEITYEITHVRWDFPEHAP